MSTFIEHALVERTNPNACQNVDWSNIRTVYRKLHQGFQHITRPFGIELSVTDNRHLKYLIGTIDAIDRNIDELPGLENRNQYSFAVVNFLRGTINRIDQTFVTEEVKNRLGYLRNAINSLGVQRQFCETVKQVFELTEAKRTATSQHEMIARMREEWRLTGQLTVLMMGKRPTVRFQKFFFLLCETMTTVDMFQDAAMDFRKGQILVPPSITLYIRLLYTFLLAIPKLMWLFPNRILLVRYAIPIIHVALWNADELPGVRDRTSGKT